MRLLKSCHLPRSRLRIPFIGLAVLLSACQLVTPAPAPESRLLPADSSANTGTTEVAGQTAGRSSTTPKQGGAAADAPQLTYTVQRGTLRSTLAMTGKVVPTRTAALALRGSGTVTGVHVRPGQSVKEGDTLIEFALDYESLQNARTQATLAELAYESEQAKLDQLKAGADQTPLQQLNATIAKDRAEIQRLELEQAQSADIGQRADAARAVQREAADRRVALAQIQFQAAQDALADARAAVQRAQDNVQLAADRAKNDQDQAAADAAGGVETAQAALRSAQRRLQENESKLAQAKLLWNETRAQQEIAALQLRVSKDQQDVQDTAALLKNAKDAASAAAASTLAAQARRSLQVDQLALDQANSNLGAAKLTDQADIKAAQIAYDQANDDLATAQVALQRAQDKAARVARDPGTPRPSVNGVGEPTDPETLQARVRDAEHRVEAERINLDDAQAARANVDVQAPDARDPRDTRTPVGSLSLDAAKAQLDADSARVAELQQGASGDEVRRQETRVNLLKDQASQAAAAAQPVVVLKAPFDATVTDVGVTDGQTVIPQAGATDVSTSPTASGSVAGQTGDGRQVAVRLAGAGVTSIVANVAETDVNQLSVGQDVSLTFPGLPGQDGSGTIAEIAAAPTVTGTNVSYPVRVDVPNAPPQLKVGMSVQLNAEVDEARDVLLVPLDAIRNVSGQALVGKIDSSSGVVQDVPVNVGRTAGLTAELTSGVNEGDVVALYTQATAAAVR